MKHGQIVAVAGPAGVGKDSLIAEGVNRGLGVRVTAWTTRPMRPSEQSGREYHFVSDEAFAELRNREHIFDESVLNGFHYGTPLRVVRAIISQGKTGFIHLSTRGCFKLKEAVRECCVVLLVPENRQQLISHMKKRGSSEAEIDARLRNDPVDWERLLDFDLVIVSRSGKIDEAADRLGEFIAARRS